MRLGATVVAQPLIGNFNILRLFGGFMAARFSSQSRNAGSKAGWRACVRSHVPVSDKV